VENTIFSIVIFFLFTFSVSAQVKGSIESQNLIKEGMVSPQINIYLQSEIKSVDDFSWTVWGLISKKWAESYIGLIYSPSKGVEVSLSYGLETNDPGQRLGWSFWMSKSNLSLTSIFEQGGSGYWFKHTLLYSLGKFNLGGHYQRGRGAGPRVEFNFSNFQVWGSYLLDKDKNNSYLGLKLKF